MKQNYSTVQGTSSIYSPPFKSGSPNAQTRLPNHTSYTNSNKEIGMKKEEHKFVNNSPTYTPTQKKFSKASPNKGENITKPIPSFIENKNGTMKGSMYVCDSILDGSPKFSKHDKAGLNSNRPKRMPRMSEATHQEMRASNIDFHNQNSKLPAFLQEKQNHSAKNSENMFSKKIPYLSDPTERPESSKEIISRLKDQITLQGSLSSSYGLMKQGRVDEKKEGSPDPTSQWVKKSWCKKKQRKVQINDFEQIRELGSGKYGQVFLAKDKKTNFICALKIVEKTLLKEQEITEQFIRELKIQTYLNHPNIIKMFGFFDDAVNIYIILEVGTGGQLFKQLKKHQCMLEQKVASTMRQICEAVNQLHSNRIIHRDIKPQNIVLHENVIKLCDFGWSVHRDESMRKTFCGTPLYVCPEILKGREYDEKIDIWSLGVMMYEMLVGQNPFNITKEEELIKIVKDNITIPSYVDISPEGKSFIDCCLQKNPDNRSNIRELIAHEFFKKYPQKMEKKVL